MKDPGKITLDVQERKENGQKAPPADQKKIREEVTRAVY